ncbi:MAG TPA: hypothetical protein VGM03_07110 [Phycisphaerae bacterium]|jgi:hypothetical protein
MKHRISLTVLAACLVSIPVAAQSGTGAPSRTQSVARVTAVGRAAGTDVRAKDEALADAKRKAVEQACGLFMNAQSETAEYQLVKDRILGNAAGYIKEYRVSREWTEGDISHCEIEATVSTAAFERDWALFAHVKEDEGNPRCVVVITEDDDIDDANPPVTNGACQAQIENFFLKHAVQLMDKGTSDDVRSRDLDLAARNKDVNKLAAAAAAFKADVLVLGDATARLGTPVEVGGQTLHRWDVTLNVRVIQTDSAQVLASKSYQPKTPYRSASAGNGARALAQLADQIAPQLLSDIGEAWRQRSVNSRIVRLSLQPCTRKQWKSIQEALAQVRGVQGGREGAKLRELVNDVADVEVNWSFDLNLLADTLEKLKVEGLAFEIIEQSANRLNVKVIARE